MVRLLDLVKHFLGHLRRLSLVGDKGLVDAEEFLVRDKRLAPSLDGGRHGVGGLDADQETALEVEDGVDVEEDLVDDVAGNHPLLLQSLFQVVQVLQVLDVFAFGVDQLLDDVVSIGHLGAVTGLSGLAIGIRLQLKEVSALFRQVQDVVNDLSDLEGWTLEQRRRRRREARPAAEVYLDKPARVVAHQIRDHEAVGRRHLELLHAGLDELEDGNLGLFGVGGIGIVDAQRLGRLQRVVDDEEGIAGAEEVPEGVDWIGRVEVLEEGLEAGHLGQALLERDAYLVEGARGVGLLVDDVARGHNRAIGDDGHVAVEGGERR